MLMEMDSIWVGVIVLWSYRHLHIFHKDRPHKWTLKNRDRNDHPHDSIFSDNSIPLAIGYLSEGDG